MSGAWLFVAGAVLGLALMVLPRAAARLHTTCHGVHGGAATPVALRAHTEEKFVFTVNGPMERVAPLFGADKERMWAPGWNPQFVHPQPAVDEEGMVFTVAQDHLRAAWVNTQFDLKNGRIQYVYVVPDVLATVITLQLTAQGKNTRVEVAYDRTSLRAESDAQVRHLAEGDRVSGPDWERQVDEYLAGVARQ